MKKRRFVNIIIILIAIIAMSFGVLFYYKLHKLQNNSNEVKVKEIDSLISKVSDLYLLPEGESPTVATVSDPLALKDKSFFTLSQKGDKVLIFYKAGKAILYRPSIDKIIEIVSIQSNSNNRNVTNLKEENTN